MASRINPTCISINASSICQLRCPECPSAAILRRIKERGADRYLKATDFDSLLDDNPWLTSVNLANFGELFMNPEIIEILRCAFERNVEISDDGGVNLNTASDEALEALVRYQVRRMSISIDGATDETYRKYRVGGDLNTVIENIKKINSYKKKHKSTLPALTWKFIIFGFNEHEISRARELAHELDMQFALDNCSCGAGSDLYPEDRGQLDYRLLDSLFSPIRDKEQVRNELGYASIDEYEQKTGRGLYVKMCMWLFEMPFIHHDGTLLGCCAIDPDYAFGCNAFKDGLLDCINSEKMRYAREMLQGRVPEGPDIPCTHCWVYIDMKTEKYWLNIDPSDCEESYIMNRLVELNTYTRRLEADFAATADAISHIATHEAQLEKALATRKSTRLHRIIKRFFG